MAENIKITIEAEDRASPVLASLQNNLNKVGTATGNLTGTLNKASNSLGNMADAFGTLESAARALAGAYAVSETLKFVNTIQELDNRLRLVTNSTRELNDTYDRLFEVAQDSRQSLDGTINLYSKLAMSADALGLNTKELTTVTENFNKTLLISGTSTTGANAALYQFAQAMQSGRLQGDELRTLLETTPKFMDVLRNSTGLTTAELRKLATDGLLSSKIVTQALTDATQDLDDQMAKMPKTVSQATTQLQNSMQKTLRSFLDATNGSEILTGAIDILTRNVEIVTIAIGTFVAAMAFGALVQAGAFALQGLAMAAGVAATGIRGLTAALTLLTGTPLGRLISLLGVAAGAAMLLSGDTDKTKESQENLTKETEKLSASTKKNSGVTAEMTKLMDEAGITADRNTTAFSKYLDEIKNQIKFGSLFSEDRKNMIEIENVLQKTVEDGRKTGKRYTESELENMRVRAQAAIAERDERLKVTAELETRYKDYLSFIKKSQDENLTDTQKYEKAFAQATQDRIDIQKFSEEDYQKYLEALRKQYSEKYFKIIQDSQMEELTETQKFQKDISTLVDDYLNGRLSKEIDFQAAKDAISVKYNKKLWDDAEKARQEEQGAFGTYSARMLELNDAYNAGRFRTDEQYYALANKARVDYVNATVSEYSTLYNTVESKLLDVLNVNKEKWPLIKDVVKLFGIDTDKILKDLFVQLLQYIIGFRGSSVAQFTAMQGETNGIFSGIGNYITNLFSGSGSLLGSIGSWVSSALNLFKGFSGSLSSIFSGIGNFISGMFGSSGSGSIISTITSGISTVVSAVSTVASAASSSLGSVASTVISGVGSALGIGGGAAAGGAAAGGAAAGGAAAGGAAAGGAAAAGGGAAAAAGGGAAAGALGMLGGALLGGAAILGLGKILDKKSPPSWADQARSNAANQMEAYVKNLQWIDTNRNNVNQGWQAISTNGLNPMTGGMFPKEYRNHYVLWNERLKQWGSDARPVDVGGLNSWFDSKFGAIQEAQNLLGPIGKEQGLSKNYSYQEAKNAMTHTYLSYGDKMFKPEWAFGAKGLGYDNGQLINNATVFGTSSGHLAVGGEMGTEAIMPLSRDSRGRLGVSMNGGGAGGVNINFTINAVDARGVDELLMSRKSLITNIVRAGVSERGVKL